MTKIEYQYRFVCKQTILSRSKENIPFTPDFLPTKVPTKTGFLVL